MARNATSGRVEIRENSLRIRFTFKGERCYETVRVDGQVLAPTKAHISYAKKLAAAIDTEIANGTFDYAQHFPDSKHAVAKAPAAERTFGELAKLWLQAKGKLEGSTKAQYESAVNCWKAMFGEDTPISKLDPITVEAKVGGHPWPSAKTHNNYMIALRGIFGLMYRGASAGESPCAGIENMPVVKKIPDPLTAGERDKVLADMRARYDVRVYAYYLFMFFTGMRPEEAIALRWSDVDWNDATVRVQRVRTFKGSERDGSKTHAERDVDLVPQALEALKLMKPFTFMLRVEDRDDDDTAADIFQNPVTKRAWHDERSQRDHYWKPTLKRLGIRARRSYCTRHTYCTVALMAGIPPAYIALQAGHSVKMLLDTYAKWIPGADGGAVRKMMALAMAGGEVPRVAANE